ncbi:P-loop NTPase [Thermodesulfobacteriota bacterium]
MKKVAISGKGGTGKSVLTTLLARVLEEEGYSVLIIDSDESNPGLYRMLGFDRSPRDLIDFFGGPQKVTESTRSVSAQTQEGPSEGVSSREKFYLQDIPHQYLMPDNGVRLASAGKITKAFEGCACPMAESLKLFLESLVLREKETVLVDMEAGVEHFSRGVEKYIDTVLILVEPSFESIALAGKINFLAQSCGVQEIWAVLNKVTSEEVDHKLKDELAKRNINTLGAIPHDEQISISCLAGGVLNGPAAKEKVRKIARSLLRS